MPASRSKRANGLRPGRRGFALAMAALLGFSACATTPPLSVKPVDPKVTRNERRINAVASNIASDQTRIVLRRQDLLQYNAQHPGYVIDRLHELLGHESSNADTLYALAELSYVLAAQGDPVARAVPEAEATSPVPAPESDLIFAGRSARGRYLAAAIYAWSFLFSNSGRDIESTIDPRAPLAAAIYNRSLAAALTTPGTGVELRAGRYGLPFGVLEVDFETEQLTWGNRRLVGFQSSVNYEVKGLRNRYRTPGIGAPLVANALPLSESTVLSDLELTETVVGATAVLVLDASVDRIRSKQLSATLELFRGREAESLRIAGRDIPLEVEPSAALAATLERSGVWRDELLAFLGRAAGIERKNQLFALEPMTPGQTPLVFVHGTNSNPAVWANMANDLQSDPQIREHFSFWFYAYDSGNPILYSSMEFRRALKGIVSRRRRGHPGGCLDEMIVVGHSQGGLLTKMTAIDSGDRFWNAMSRKPFDEVRIRASRREQVREAIFVEPLPFVRRVVFISTPHRGSFLAGPEFVRRLASRVIQFPTHVAKLSADLARISRSGVSDVRYSRLSTSLDNMSPGDAFIETIAEISVVPEIADHSIVTVTGSGPPEGGDDGVVRYESAHRTDVDSELVVRSGHSSYSNPNTVNEVERILRLQIAESTCGDGAGEVAANELSALPGGSGGRP